MRVDKRKLYYRIYHELDRISECKEISLYAFWIMKLKPFSMTDYTHKFADIINECFSIYLILLTIKGCCLHKKIAYNRPSDEFISNVIYSFRFHDLSKESIILFADTLAFSYGINQVEGRSLMDLSFLS